MDRADCPQEQDDDIHNTIDLRATPLFPLEYWMKVFNKHCPG